MKPASEETWLRAAFATLADEPGKGSEEVDSERVWQAVAGELSPSETGELLDRAVESGALAEAWRLAYALRAAGPALRPAEDRHRSAFNATRWSGLAAAAILLVLVGWQALEMWRRPAGPVYRTTEPAALVSRIPDDTVLARDRFVLRWSAPPAEGVRFRLRLTTESLETVAEVQGLTEMKYRVPAQLLKRIEDGSRLLWLIEADYPDGNRRTSATFFVRVE